MKITGNFHTWQKRCQTRATQDAFAKLLSKLKPYIGSILGYLSLRNINGCLLSRENYVFTKQPVFWRECIIVKLNEGKGSNKNNIPSRKRKGNYVLGETSGVNVLQIALNWNLLLEFIYHVFD